MEIWWIIAACGLLLLNIILMFYLILMRRSVGEVAEGLAEKLRTDTNTLISISSGDRAVRKLAGEINMQLRSLRLERLRLQNGDNELKAAVTNISHDLRTPLTAICGYLDLLEREEHSEKTKHYLAIIRERTDAMRVLTEELFQYSVITSQAEKLNMEPVSLNSVLEQSLAGFYGVMSSRGIVPEIRMPEKAVVRILNQDALRRAFDNILSNAVKYSDGDAEITLSEKGVVTFANSAGKLSSVQTQRLFDRFFTVETARGSTGIGLSIAKLLTEKMGGDIAAEYKNGKLYVHMNFPK